MFIKNIVQNWIQIIIIEIHVKIEYKALIIVNRSINKRKKIG